MIEKLENSRVSVMWNLQALMKRMLLWNSMDKKLLEDGSRLIQIQEPLLLAQEVTVVVVVVVVEAVVSVVVVADEVVVGVAVVSVVAVAVAEVVAVMVAVMVAVGHPDQGCRLMPMHQALESIRR